MKTYITLKQLERAGACASQRRVFKRQFGARVRVSEKLAEIYAEKFNWAWAAYSLLTPQALRVWCRVDARIWRSGLGSSEHRSARARAFARAFLSEANNSKGKR